MESQNSRKVKNKLPGVWYYKKSNPDDDEQLKFSVRSACKNLNLSKVIIIGDKPSWFRETENSIYISNQPVKGRLWTIGWVPFQQFKKFMEYNWDFDDFLLFNDDFFVLQPVKRWVDYERTKESYERLTARCKPYHMLTLNTFRLVDGRHYFNLHIPMRLKVSNLKIMFILWDNIQNKNLDFRTLYGNLFIKDYPHLKAISDVKIFQDNAPIEGTFISTWSKGFSIKGEVYNKITQMFPDPCFCENKKIEKI